MKNSTIFLAITSQLFACFAAAAAVANEPIVKISSGKVSGTTLTVNNNQTVYFFEGIKYGQAERFALPTPAAPWSGVHRVVGWRDACIQPAIDQPVLGRFQQTTNISEDCLYLNVWTPGLMTTSKNDSQNLPPHPLLPVMVWIYGGAFERGHIFTDLLDGRQFAAQGNLVFVSFNFRVGPFGFAYFGEGQPSNYGFFDQLLALKFVKENIAAFGGDPNKVTLFCESTGSVSVGALILSPLAAGLFHRAIMQSGAPTSPTRVSSPSRALNITQSLAQQLNCSVESSSTRMLECLKGKSVLEILSISKDAAAQNRLFLPIYGDRFLPLKPSKALQTGAFNPKISLLFGVNRDEGSLGAARWLPTDEKLQQQNKVALARSAIQSMLRFFFNVTDDDSERIVGHYTASLSDQFSTAEDVKLAIASVFADINFVCPTILFAEHYHRSQPKSSSSSTFYSYRLVQPVTFPPFCSGGHFPGVCHAVDLLYIFAMPNQLPAGFPYTDDHLKLSADMLADWLSFAKWGKVANQSWKQAFEDNDKTKAVELVSERYQMISQFYLDSCNALWEEKLFSAGE